jgi:hypothetical protein
MEGQVMSTHDLLASLRRLRTQVDRIFRDENRSSD